MLHPLAYSILLIKYVAHFALEVQCYQLPFTFADLLFSSFMNCLVTGVDKFIARNGVEIS